jgi:SAM-dependent methyltransferase
MPVRDELLREFDARRRHAWDKLRWSIPTEHRHDRFLDIGCGCGSGLIAALQHGFEAAVGLDRSFKEFGWFDIEDFDPLCLHFGVNPANATLIEGDLFGISLQPKAFSCVLMLDSIEHVPDPRKFIAAAARYVAPGGYLFIDTAPLYYSKVGHHLFSEFPPDLYPWAHLRKDWPQLQCRSDVSDWSMDRFRELNKVTHDQVRQFVTETGLEIVDEHRDVPTSDDLHLLEQHRSSLDLAGLDERLLFESWILVLARRPDRVE